MKNWLPHLTGVSLVVVAVFATRAFVQSRFDNKPPSPSPVSLQEPEPVLSLPPLDPAILEDYERFVQLCGEIGLNPTGEGGRNWLQEALITLGEQGVSWPAITMADPDHIVRHNVAMHEHDAVKMLQGDPVEAANFLAARIRDEEEKFEARSWRKTLRASASKTGSGPTPEVVAEMLTAIPERYFSAMLDETLKQHPSDEVARSAMALSTERTRAETLRSLAIIAENPSLGEEVQADAIANLAEQLHVSLSDPGTAELDWIFEVSELLNAEELEASGVTR